MLDRVLLEGPVAKFVSEPRNGRIGSAFKLGCPRMAVVKCGPPDPPHGHFQTLRQARRKHAQSAGPAPRLAQRPEPARMAWYLTVDQMPSA